MSSTPFFSRFHSLRSVGGKLRRRVKKLAGKPDNSPWILQPRKSSAHGAYVDFIFALDYLSPNSPLVGIFHEIMSAHGLRALLVNQANVDAVIAQIETGWLKPHVLLDLASSTQKRFADLALAASTAGVYVIDKPLGLTNWTNKSTSHVALEKAGLPLPPSVILSRGEADRELTADERQKVGDRCVIKPSAGFGNRGVVIGVAPTLSEIKNARDFDRNDDWLIQKMISWMHYETRPAYLRAYYLLGHRSLMWWCKGKEADRYDLLTWDDLKKYDLLEAVELVDKIAQVSGIDFFSSEIAITSDTGPSRFVLIDYINDQCDMDPEERPATTPVPTDWVRWVCKNLADFTLQKKRGVELKREKSLTLF